MIPCSLDHLDDDAATVARLLPEYAGAELEREWKLRLCDQEPVEGGQAVVWKAEVVQAKGQGLEPKYAAVKVFKVFASEEAGKRLHERSLAEARLLQKLDGCVGVTGHRHTFTLWSSRLIVLALDWCEGCTWHEWIEVIAGEPSADARWSKLRSGCQALLRAYHELHSHTAFAGRAHGDVSPTNVLVSENGQTVTATIIDLGYASCPETAPLLRGSTPGFRAPETTKGLPVTQSSDQWVLGMMILRALNRLGLDGPCIGVTPVSRAQLRKFKLVAEKMCQDAPTNRYKSIGGAAKALSRASRHRGANTNVASASSSGVRDGIRATERATGPFNTALATIAAVASFAAMSTALLAMVNPFAIAQGDFTPSGLQSAVGILHNGACSWLAELQRDHSHWLYAAAGVVGIVSLPALLSWRLSAHKRIGIHPADACFHAARVFLTLAGLAGLCAITTALTREWHDAVSAAFIALNMLTATLISACGDRVLIRIRRG